MNFITFLKGKKVYFLAVALLAYTIGGVATGHMDLQTALTLIYSSGLIAAFRGAIASHQNAVNQVLNAVTTANQLNQSVPTGATYTSQVAPLPTSQS